MDKRFGNWRDKCKTGVLIHRLEKLKPNISLPCSELDINKLSVENYEHTPSQVIMTTYFNSKNDWQRDFIACCNSSRCGWVVTYLNTYAQKYMNCVIDLHSQNVPAGFYPVIVVDVWQHAYYRDYLKDVKTYTAAMMKELNWNVIEKRFEKADKILQVLRG